MRSFIALSSLLALVAAAPASQDIDFDLADSVPNPSYVTSIGVTAQLVTYDATSVLAAAAAQITATETDDSGIAARNEKRTACQVQPTGAKNAPTVSTDTPAAFTANAAFASLANAAPTPSGYVNAFTNLHGSNNAYGYMGYTTLDTYDVNTCANKCNAINGCMSFNLYFERDPSVDPGTGCDNPPSVTMIKCVFWGGPVNSGNAVNMGQWRSNFQVVIAGSNGYTNTSIAIPPGYGTANYLGTSAINAPLDSYGFDSYMGSAIFNSGPFNAQLCADACSMKSQYNLAHPPTDGSPVQTCQFFNTYILYINTTSHLQGQYCAMYSESWANSYGTNNGQYRGSDHYLIEFSYTYSNSTSSGPACKDCAVHQASKDISYSTLQTYCSSLLGYTASATATASATSAALTTPAALTRYPGAVVTSACSLQATPLATTSSTASSSSTTSSSTTSSSSTSTPTATPQVY